MDNFTFNKKDFDKLTDIASTLIIVAKAKGVVSIIIGDQEIDMDKAYDFLNEIHDKEPSLTWSDFDE